MTNLLLHINRGPHQGAAKFEASARSAKISMTVDQLLHPHEPGDYLVHQGRLRVSELLPNGRELTRAVLHAGSVFNVTSTDSQDADPTNDVYPLQPMILMALANTQIMTMPPDTPSSGRKKS